MFGWGSGWLEKCQDITFQYFSNTSIKKLAGIKKFQLNLLTVKNFMKLNSKDSNE